VAHGLLSGRVRLDCREDSCRAATIAGGFQVVSACVVGRHASSQPDITARAMGGSDSEGASLAGTGTDGKYVLLREMARDRR